MKTIWNLIMKSQTWNNLYFQVSPSSHLINCVRSCRPFLNLLTSSAGLVGCRPGLGSWLFQRPGQATEEISSPNETCRRYQQIEERPTGRNTNNWMGWQWNLILIEIFPSVHETWHFKPLWRPRHKIKNQRDQFSNNYEVGNYLLSSELNWIFDNS